jgi:hypothetical protein
MRHLLMYTYMHAGIHTCTHICIHTCIHPYSVVANEGLSNILQDSRNGEPLEETPRTPENGERISREQSRGSGAPLGHKGFIVRGNSAQKTQKFARNTGALIPCLSFPVISVTFAVFRCCYVGLPHFLLPCPPLL